MLKAKLANGAEIGYTFEHDCEGQLTICYVFSSDKSPIGVGMAFCHPKDKFNKTIGRKIALRDALKKCNFSYEDRTAVWQNVLQRQPKTFIGKKQ